MTKQPAQKQEAVKKSSTILSKLLDFQKSQITIKKDASNPFFGSKYATLENILETITPDLNRLGILITHTLHEGNIITQVFDTDSNDSIKSVFPVFGTKPQEIGSSISYARRYNITTLLNLSIDDDDGNKANNSQKITGKKCEKCSKNMVLGKDGQTYYCVACWKLNKSSQPAEKAKVWDK